MQQRVIIDTLALIAVAQVLNYKEIFGGIPNFLIKESPLKLIWNTAISTIEHFIINKEIVIELNTLSFDSNWIPLLNELSQFLQYELGAKTIETIEIFTDFEKKFWEFWVNDGRINYLIKYLKESYKIVYEFFELKKIS
ncbi:MAG: hypothetical protein GXO21_00450 [Aquificae bacterium]|nr:hypothetical protein [Aquificota bacterium]